MLHIEFHLSVRSFILSIRTFVLKSTPSLLVLDAVGRPLLYYPLLIFSKSDISFITFNCSCAQYIALIHNSTEFSSSLIASHLSLYNLLFSVA